MFKVLFVKTKNLGDALVLTGAIDSVRENVIVHVLCFADVAPLYQMVPRVEKTYTVTRGARGWRSVTEHINLLLELRRNRYTHLCQFSDDWRGALLSRILRPPFSAAFFTKRRPDSWHRSFSHVCMPDWEWHAVRRDFELVRRVGIVRPGSNRPLIRLSPESKLEAGARSGTRKLPYVVLQAASRWTFKQLELATLCEVAHGLSDRGYLVVLSGSCSDIELNRKIQVSCKGDNVLVEVTNDYSAFIRLVMEATMVLTIDSFALHVAEALSVPVVSIFGPTDERVWGPQSKHSAVVTVGGNFMCRPCQRDGCDGSKKSLCLQEITSEQVLRAVDKLIGPIDA